MSSCGSMASIRLSRMKKSSMGLYVDGRSSKQGRSHKRVFGWSNSLRISIRLLIRGWSTYRHGSRQTCQSSKQVMLQSRISVERSTRTSSSSRGVFNCANYNARVAILCVLASDSMRAIIIAALITHAFAPANSLMNILVLLTLARCGKPSSPSSFVSVNLSESLVPATKEPICTVIL